MKNKTETGYEQFKRDLTKARRGAFWMAKYAIVAVAACWFIFVVGFVIYSIASGIHSKAHEVDRASLADARQQMLYLENRIHWLENPSKLQTTNANFTNVIWFYSNSVEGNLDSFMP